MKKKTTSGGAPIIPAGDRVLIRPLAEDEAMRKSPHGIIIPETARDEKTDRGTVVAVGAGRVTDEGKVIPPRVKAGDLVLFQWGEKVKVDGVEYFLVSEGNILATVRK